MVSAPLQNNITRPSGVLTKDKQIKQSNQIGPLLQELVWTTERWQEAVPMTFVSDIFGE